MAVTVLTPDLSDEAFEKAVVMARQMVETMMRQARQFQGSITLTYKQETRPLYTPEWGKVPVDCYYTGRAKVVLETSISPIASTPLPAEPSRDDMADTPAIRQGT